MLPGQIEAVKSKEVRFLLASIKEHVLPALMVTRLRKHGSYSGLVLCYCEQVFCSRLLFMGRVNGDTTDG